MNKNLRTLLAAFPDWKFDGYTAKGHIRLRHTPTGRMWFAPSTPSDRRGNKNLATDLKRIARGGA